MIRKFEELSMCAWPCLQTKLYDGWILRFSNGYTRRSNSVNPIYESTINLDEKIDYCEKQYSQLNLPTIFKLTKESKPEEIDQRLEQRGYGKFNETSLRILPIDKFIHQEIKNIIVNNKLKEEWLNAFFNCSNISDEITQRTAKKVLDNIIGKTIYVGKQVDGKIVGCGYGEIEGDNIGIFDIVVHRDYRGNGYAKDILHGIIGVASENKVKIAYLQVTCGNVPAERLYDKLGFEEIYKYWYRMK